MLVVGMLGYNNRSDTFSTTTKNYLAGSLKYTLKIDCLFLVIIFKENASKNKMFVNTLFHRHTKAF